MDEKKKILLGEKDIIARDNEDLYININLNSTFAEIRDDKYENEFDVEKQFKKERNASRDFRIYGIIDATIADCDNLNLSVYKFATSGTGINSGVTTLSGFIKTVPSSELVYDGYNTFGHKKGKYLIELTGYTEDYVYIKIPTNNFNYKDQIYSQQLIFRDTEGNFVDYGTQTIDIDDNGNAIEINNDFYFLYNKHWIKKDLYIVEEKQAKISMSAVTSPAVVAETNLPSTQFSVVLDKPSPFGLETATIVMENASLSLAAGEVSIQDSFGSYSLPFNISFAQGEQFKTFDFYSTVDTLQEFTEDITLGLNNFNLVQTASPLTHTIFVTDSTPRNKVALNFQDIYQNRNYFTGIVRQISPSSPNMYSYPLGAVLRNGLMYEGTPMEFYPSDNFTLKIKNVGANTILPVNPVLGIFSEQVFPAGQQLTFQINTQYQNTQKHAIKFYLANVNLTTVSTSPYKYSYNLGFMINGIPVFDYYKNYKVDYEKLLGALTNTNIASMPGNPNISGWNRYNLEIPFDVIPNLSAKTITIIAKSPGTRLDIETYGGFPDIFDSTDTSLISLGLTAETIQSFVHSAQTPLEIVLGANFNSNTEAVYNFFVSKPGFDSMQWTTSPLPASISGTPYFLASGYHDIIRNWDNANNKPVYIHSGVTSNHPYTYYTTGAYTTGEAYINGIVFLANKYFDNTTNTGTYTTGGGSLNSSHFTNLVGDYAADFLPAPLVTIPETSEYYSPQTKAQVGFLSINRYPLSSVPSGAKTFRSFDFRTGATANYTTFYAPASQNFQGLYTWNGSIGMGLYASGGTGAMSSTGSSRALKTYLQLGTTAVPNTPQGLIGTSPISSAEYGTLMAAGSYGQYYDFIKLEATTPGVPFEITNVNDMKLASGGLLITGGSINYYPLIPNEIAGVTINEANNKMGGYSLTRPTTPLSITIRTVSFEFPVYFVNPFQPQTVKISLNNPSITGSESVVVDRLTSSSAILGLHYSEAQTLSYAINWAVGEQHKFITFTSLQNNSSTRDLFIQISSLVNLNPGSFTTTLLKFN
jgi:hypothetical protein